MVGNSERGLEPRRPSQKPVQNSLKNTHGQRAVGDEKLESLTLASPCGSLASEPSGKPHGVVVVARHSHNKIEPWFVLAEVRIRFRSLRRINPLGLEQQGPFGVGAVRGLLHDGCAAFVFAKGPR